MALHESNRIRRPLLRRQQVAQILGVSLHTLDRLPLHRIELRTRPGGVRPAIRYDPDELDAYLEALKQDAAAGR